VFFDVARSFAEPAAVNFLRRIQSKLSVTSDANPKSAGAPGTAADTAADTAAAAGTDTAQRSPHEIQTIDADGKVVRLAPGFNPSLLLTRHNEELQFEEVRARSMRRRDANGGGGVGVGVGGSGSGDVPQLEHGRDMRERIDALIAAVRVWKPQQAPRVDMLALLASVELDAHERDQFSSNAFAVPRQWLDAVRQHTVAPTHAPPPVPMPLHTLDLNATASTAVFVSEPTWNALCAAFGSTGAWQRGAEPSLAIRIVAAAGADDRSVVLLVPYRARLSGLLSRACAGMFVSPRGRALFTHDSSSALPITDATVGDLFVSQGCDVRSASVADVRHPQFTVSIGKSSASPPVPETVADGLALLSQSADAVSAASAAAKAAFSALLEWREAMAAAKQHLTSQHAHVL
jgi:hypothetical protein